MLKQRLKPPILLLPSNSSFSFLQFLQIILPRSNHYSSSTSMTVGRNWGLIHCVSIQFFSVSLLQLEALAACVVFDQISAKTVSRVVFGVPKVQRKRRRVWGTLPALVAHCYRRVLATELRWNQSYRWSAGHFNNT